MAPLEGHCRFVRSGIGQSGSDNTQMELSHLAISCEGWKCTSHVAWLHCWTRVHDVPLLDCRLDDRLGHRLQQRLAETGAPHALRHAPQVQALRSPSTASNVAATAATLPVFVLGRRAKLLGHEVVSVARPAMHPIAAPAPGWPTTVSPLTQLSLLSCIGTTMVASAILAEDLLGPAHDGLQRHRVAQKAGFTTIEKVMNA